MLDANVPSEPARPVPNINVVNWLRRNEREIAVDSVILGQVRFGIFDPFAS